MKYRIVYDTSADKYAERLYVLVGPAQLARKIMTIQAQGQIIHSVRREN